MCARGFALNMIVRRWSGRVEQHGVDEHATDLVQVQGQGDGSVDVVARDTAL